MESMKERLEKARKAGRTENLAVHFIKLDKPGTKILGEFVSNTLVNGREFDGQYYQYIFATDDGPVKCHFGGAFDQEYADMLVCGQLYEIEYTGSDDIGNGRTIKRYNVEAILPASDR